MLNLAGTLHNVVTFELSNCTNIPELPFGNAITVPVYSPLRTIYFRIFLNGFSSNYFADNSYTLFDISNYFIFTLKYPPTLYMSLQFTI